MNLGHVDPVCRCKVSFTQRSLSLCAGQVWKAAGGRIRDLLRAMIPVLAFAAPAAAQEVSTQFWPEIDTFIKLNDRMRLFVPIADTRTGVDSSDQNGTTGIYFDYFSKPIAKLRFATWADASRSRRLTLRVGYAYSAPGSGNTATNTVVAEATGRLFLPGEILVSDRNRFDLNFTGGEFDPRYRNRLRLERDIDLGKPTLTAYVLGEFFYSFNRGDWFRTRVAGGLELHVWERFVPEVYFQRDYNTGTSADVNGFGLVLSIYLR
ncbi:MAG: DUF2490 domain-containing protein [Gammaproteobacteria bacterium]